MQGGQHPAMYNLTRNKTFGPTAHGQAEDYEKYKNQQRTSYCYYAQHLV